MMRSVWVWGRPVVERGAVNQERYQSYEYVASYLA